MSLIEQRNRFLSFAFAAADVLVETDREGNVLYAAGATAALGEPPLEDAREDFARRLDPTSRPIMKALLRGIRAGRRTGPVRVSAGRRPATLSGWFLGNDDRVRWTLSFESATQPDEVDPDAFARSAETALQEARKQGEAMQMSVLRISGIEDIETRLGPDDAEMLCHAVQSECQLAVGTEGVARAVDGNRIALIHRSDCNIAGLRRTIAKILRDHGFADASVSIDSMNDAMDVEPDIAVRAFIHAVNEAADSAEGLNITSLKEAASLMMQEASRQMNRLRTSIAGRSFEPYAQPIINLRSGNVRHYELLLRLPDGGSIDASVGFAESTGVIREIDMAMTELALNFLLEHDNAPNLAVNLSGNSLSDKTWTDKFLSLLEDVRIDRSRLSFELTETATIKKVHEVNSVIQKVRERGHRVCLDDFGTGSASFQYLRDFPADIVKIDGSFVQRVGKTDRDTALLRGMIAVCQDLGAETVAEKVETKAQAAKLKAMGVTLGQGYYFGKPIPLETVLDPNHKANRAA
jgi:EAL domain-containing protein (putative c-di-GMP-specific phosphodiesterase class I)